MQCYHFYNFRVVKRLIFHYKCNGIEIKCGKSTPMHLACENGQVEVVKTIATMAPQWINSSDEDNDMKTPLHVALEKNYIGIVKVLVMHKPKLCSTRDGITPIHMAVQKGNIEVVKTLLSAYLNEINCTDNKGQTPLHYAAQHCGDHPEIVTELIQK